MLTASSFTTPQFFPDKFSTFELGAQVQFQCVVLVGVSTEVTVCTSGS